MPRSVCLSVCPGPRRAAALGYRHAGCLQLSHVRTVDLSADGCRSAASRTAIGGGHIVSIYNLLHSCSCDLFSTAAEKPVTCPRNGHVTADVDPITGQGHVIFGEPRSPMTTTTVPHSTRSSQVEPHRSGPVTISDRSTTVGGESCPWTLRAMTGTGRRTIRYDTIRYEMLF